MVITEQQILANGINWLVNEVKEFEINENVWYTPFELTLVLNSGKFKYTTKQFGSGDNAYTKYYFKLKTEEELLKEQQEKDLQYQISLIEKKFNVKLQIV